MSSKYVRDSVKNFFSSDIPSETNILDLTGESGDFKEFLNHHSIPYNGTWIGLQFVPGAEEPIGLAADGNQGLYRENGIAFIHIVEPGAIGVGGKLTNRAEIIRNAFRGKRIGDMLIETVSPLNTEAGGTLEFDGGFVSGSVIISYQYDNKM